MSVTHRNGFVAYPPQNVLPELFDGTPNPTRLKAGSAVGVHNRLAKRKVPPPQSAPGFLLTDSQLHPVWFNAEAIQILSYPDTLTNLKRASALLSRKIRFSLLNQHPSRQSPFVTEFWSGRRHYFCRAFFMGLNAKDPSRASIAILLERRPPTPTSLSIVSLQFNLTPREQEALKYLLLGLSNKEIANRMNISPNTVKAFLRLIMTKMGVSSRATIIAKILAIQRL